MKQTTKFLHIVMCMVLGLSVSMTSCKDYDDDIDNLQQQIDENKSAIADLEKAIESGKWVSSYEPSENGYVLTLSDGSKLEIKNGANGEKGDTGLQGPEGPIGPQGPAGETIVPEFGVDAEGYWQYKVGGDWIYVKDQEGNKIKAQGERGEQGEPGEPGEAGGNNVTFNADGYIQIGDKVTDLKATGNRPVMVADTENGTLALTWEGKTYTLLMAGSEYDGLQSLVYRRMAYDDMKDVNSAYVLGYTNPGTKEWDTIASVPGSLQFKVLPREFDVKKASYNFFDTHLTKAAAEPSIVYVNGSAKLENGILTVGFVPENLDNTEEYASTLEVTLNGKTTSSDYFNVAAGKLNVEDAIVFVQSEDNEEVPANQVSDMKNGNIAHAYHYQFVYTTSYALNDSIAFGLLSNGGERKSFEELGVGEYLKTTYELTEGQDNGLFELSEDGVITVKKENQGSAINEYCYVTVTYEVVNALGNVVSTEVRNLAIQAVLSTVTYGGVEIMALTDGDLAMVYDPEAAQVVVLDVRKFEDEIGGRNILNPDNSKANSKVWALGYYNNNEELVAVNPGITLPSVTNAPASNTFNPNEGEMFLYFKASDNSDAVTSEDSLFLIVGAKTYFENVVERDYYAVVENGGEVEKAVAGTNNFFLNVGIDKTIKVTRYEALVDANGNARVRGLWNASKEFTMSANLTNYYKVVPSDVKLAFVLAPKDEQPAAVQEVYDLLKIDGTSGNYIFTATPVQDRPIDVNVVKDIKVYAYNEAEVNDPNAKPLVDNLKLQLTSPLNNITLAKDKAESEIKNNEGKDITRKLLTIMAPSLTDKYELDGQTNTAQKVIVNGTIQPGFGINEDVVTYGVYPLVYSIANLAEVEASVGENTVSIDAATGELTIKDTQTVFGKTTIKINVTCKHSWGSSAPAKAFEYTIYRN